MHTGTGNFIVPIALPPGRNGFQPQQNLTYGSGNGNGNFGLGWSPGIPDVMRKTSKGIPRYRDYEEEVHNWDTFVLSGAEDLVPVVLLDETNQVTDVTFASLSAAKEAHKNPEHNAPIKGANRQVDGTVAEPLRADRITLKTGEGNQLFEVRDVMHERISRLQKGESVILLVDNENKVVDIAVPTQ